jgi:hypothetical protein
MTNREVDQRMLLIKQDAEIERLKALLTRAADALDGYNSVVPSARAKEIIDELRKAAP